MSNLPNPNDFKNFKADLSKRIQFEDSEPSYNIDNIYTAMKNNSIPSGRVSQLIDKEILHSIDDIQKVLKRCILFDTLHQSIAIAIKEDEQIKTIAIHRSKDQEGNLIKWKTLGSKSFIPYKIRDNSKIVFVLVGMKEYLLMELLQFDYIVPQSDSIIKNISNNRQWVEEIKPKIKDKLIVYISENDKSSQELINPLKEEHSNIINIDINSLYLFHIMGNGGRDQELPKGYDFIDFCNMFKDIESIQMTIKEFIQMELKQ
jgi:hypothetical protein